MHIHPHNLINDHPQKIYMLCGPVVSTFFSLCASEIFFNTFAWGRIQIVGGARCSSGQPALKLDSLSTSVEVCWMKRENVPQRCNISFALAIVTSVFHVRQFSQRWKEYVSVSTASKRRCRFTVTCADSTLKTSGLWRNETVPVCLSKYSRSIHLCFPAASCPWAVKLTVHLSSSLVLAFAFHSSGSACFGSDSTLVPQRYSSRINILYDGNIVWMCDKACQHRN